MSLKQLRNHPSRNGFDLSRKNAFTAKTGELLPVACIECIPGDKIKLSGQAFARTQPINTAAYTRIREYYDVFFVPYRLLWRSFDDFITQMNDSQHSDTIFDTLRLDNLHPYFTVKQIFEYLSYISGKNLDRKYKYNQFGFSRVNLTCKLLDYLGYGDYSGLINSDGVFDFGTLMNDDSYNLSLNPFPLLAYQKICQDYFRNSQWKKSQPYRFNVDYIGSGSIWTLPINSSNIPKMAAGENMFDLNYCNWSKDYFMGLMPEAQYGDTAVAAPLQGSLPLYDYNRPIEDVNYKQTEIMPDGLILDGSDGSKIRMSNTAGISVLALRQYEFLQKWKEIAQSGNKDYKSQISKHFGVDVPDSLSSMSRYIGGWSSNFDISEVVNTNLADSSSDADIAGKGVGTSQGGITFESKGDYGILMVMYHNMPLLDYSNNGVKRLNQKIHVTDYAIPEMDSIGMQTVPLTELAYFGFVGGVSPGIIPPGYLLGYAPRYVDYKTAYDEIHGSFNGSMKHWVSSIDMEYISTYISTLPSGSLEADHFLNSTFFQVNPSLLDRIFAVSADSSVDTDQFLINSFFDIKAVRNLDYNGLPY